MHSQLVSGTQVHQQHVLWLQAQQDMQVMQADMIAHVAS